MLMSVANRKKLRLSPRSKEPNARNRLNPKRRHSQTTKLSQKQKSNSRSLSLNDEKLGSQRLSKLRFSNPRMGKQRRLKNLTRESSLKIFSRLPTHLL